MALVSDVEIQSALKDLPGWTYIDSVLHKDLTFDSYMEGINFVNVLAEVAEMKNHHPDLTVGWRKVKVTFTSHDQGGVTDQCLTMAGEVERLNRK